MSKKRNIKIPIIQPLRNQGGTFYTFASAIEDIGLNVTERIDTVKLTHYALLDIPICDENTNSDINKFNIFSMPGAVSFRAKNENINMNSNINIAQSFLSYALNLENAILNKDDYNYASKLSISERVFWKWLKETGAIRWYKDPSTNYIMEGDIKNNLNYNKVVKAIGKIDAVNSRTNEYGTHNEIFVNIPSSFGDMPIYFIEDSDDNYGFGMQIESYDTLVDNENIFIKDSSLYNVAFNDYTSNNIPFINTDNKQGTTWCTINNISGLNTTTNYYIIDNQVKDNENENYKVNIEYNDVSYSFLRSKYDCLRLDLLLNNETYENKTYDDIAKLGSDFKFNAILLYYSIFDGNNINRATNLYGIYFINPSNETANESSDPGNININNSLEFYIPTLNKIKSTDQGFGTSYSFKINMKTSSIYDNTSAPIVDNSSSENSIVNDFNNVLANLSTSIDLLNKQVKHSSVISEKYNKLNDRVLNITNEVKEIGSSLNDLLNKHTSSITCDTIETNNLIVNNNVNRLIYDNNVNITTDEDIEERINKLLASVNIVYENDKLYAKAVERENQTYSNVESLSNNDMNNLIFALLYKIKNMKNTSTGGGNIENGDGINSDINLKISELEKSIANLTDIINDIIIEK